MDLSSIQKLGNQAARGEGGVSDCSHPEHKGATASSEPGASPPNHGGAVCPAYQGSLRVSHRGAPKLLSLTYYKLQVSSVFSAQPLETALARGTRLLLLCPPPRDPGFLLSLGPLPSLLPLERRGWQKLACHCPVTHLYHSRAFLLPLFLANGSPGYSETSRGCRDRRAGLGEPGSSTEPWLESPGKAMDLSVDFLRGPCRFTRAAWLRSEALVEVGLCSPFLLGGQVGQGLQLCLGILGDPGSTKKRA